MYNYKVEVKEIMTDHPLIIRTSSNFPFTRNDLIKKWKLNDTDIEWFEIYIMKDGKEVQL